MQTKLIFIVAGISIFLAGAASDRIFLCPDMTAIDRASKSINDAQDANTKMWHDYDNKQRKAEGR